MARPTFIGNVIRRIDMRCTMNGSNKDYRITIAQDGATALCRVYTEYGPSGSLKNGKEFTKSPVSEGLAHAEADQICRDKQSQRDAYTVLSDHAFAGNATPTPRPAPKPSPAPRRPQTSINDLSPASREVLATLF